MPKHFTSGLRGGAGAFDDNILDDPLAPQKIVHDKSLGYVIDPVAVTQSPLTGTPLIPFPLNQGANATGSNLTTYTWRDTAALGIGGPNGAGVPLDIEGGTPLLIVPQNEVGGMFPSGRVGTIGLPLLMEYRCYPSDEGLGLNPLDISLAINSSAIPAFRTYSSGGVNTSGVVETVEPDFENRAAGGFNGVSNPPGKPTRRSDDNAFYVGQLDVVIRVSRAHTVWIDTGFEASQFLNPVVIPDPTDQPDGTSVVVDFRGATGFDTVTYPTAIDLARDAANIDTYGTLRDTSRRPPVAITVDYVGGNRLWENQISELDGARYFQMRFSFFNNIGSGVAPDLSAVGIAFIEQ